MFGAFEDVKDASVSNVASYETDNAYSEFEVKKHVQEKQALSSSLLSHVLHNVDFGTPSMRRNLAISR